MPTLEQNKSSHRAGRPWHPSLSQARRITANAGELTSAARPLVVRLNVLVSRLTAHVASGSRGVLWWGWCRKFVGFGAALSGAGNNGGGHMLKILLTVAALGSVASFAGLAMAQGKQGEA